MYCTQCGKPLARVSLRCPECRRLTPAFWLNFSAFIFLVITAAANSMYFEFLVPIVATYFASMEVVFPLPARLHLAFYQRTVELLPFVVVALIVVWLLARFKKIRVPRIFVSGKLLTVLVWGVLAFTFVGWIGTFVEVAIQLPNPILQQRIFYRLAAVHSLIRISEAEAKYRQTYPKIGYTCSLDDMKAPASGQPADANHAGLLDASLTRGTLLGYTMKAKECSGKPVARYVVTAVPLETATGAQRVYCTNETGAIHYSDDGKDETCLQKFTPTK